MQRTAVLVKPDALQRGLIGEIIGRIEKKGLKIVGLKMVSFEGELVERWYEHIKDKDFFPRVRKYMTSTPIVALVIEGYEAVDVVRRLCGEERRGWKAEQGSLRGDLSMSGGFNIVHSSDSVPSANREIPLLFKDSEIHDYVSLTQELIYDEDEKA
ncbi:nucleoside-diphosphate kinase [Candidatus Woesebacteria bacterium]|nr:nucleoside-diphosphate kinase [Candidatus Woesebacteria bacterium]